MIRQVRLGLWTLGTILGNAAFFGAIILGGFVFGTWRGRREWPSEFGPMALVIPGIAAGIIVGAFLIWKCEVRLHVWLAQPTQHDQELVEQYYSNG